MSKTQTTPKLVNMMKIELKMTVKSEEPPVASDVLLTLIRMVIKTDPTKITILKRVAAF
jgi:hypothetical protein